MHTQLGKLTRIKAEVTGLLFDGHGMEGSLRLSLWGPRGAHGGDPLFCVPRVHQFLLEALGGHGDQGLRHLPVVGGPPVAGHSVVVAAAAATAGGGGGGGLGQELGALLAL